MQQNQWSSILSLKFRANLCKRSSRFGHFKMHFLTLSQNVENIWIKRHVLVTAIENITLRQSEHSCYVYMDYYVSL